MIGIPIAERRMSLSRRSLYSSAYDADMNLEIGNKGISKVQKKKKNIGLVH